MDPPVLERLQRGVAGRREGLTEEAAREQVAAAWEAAGEAVRGYTTHLLLEDSKSMTRGREGEESRRKQLAEQAERDARLGRKALERLFGSEVAAAIKPHQQYEIVQEWIGERLYAVPIGKGESVVAALNRAGANADLSSRAGPGYRLGAVVAPLGKDFPLAAVVNGDEALERAVELVRADVAERREADERDRKRMAAESAAVRKADEQRRTFGVEVD